MMQLLVEDYSHVEYDTVMVGNLYDTYINIQSKHNYYFFIK